MSVAAAGSNAEVRAAVLARADELDFEVRHAARGRGGSEVG
jgi:hypothetical protein